MKFKFENLRAAFKEVFQHPAYWVISLLVSAIIFSFNLLVINYSALIHFFNAAFIWGLIRGTFGGMMFFSQVTLILTSLLTGILFAMLVFKLKYIKDNLTGAASTGLVGATIGVLLPACSTCGLGLIALLGYASLIAVLPFKGLELGFVAVILLLFAIFYISTQIVEKQCKVKRS